MSTPIVLKIIKPLPPIKTGPIEKSPDEYTSFEWQPSKPSKIQEKLKEKIKIARETDEIMANCYFSHFKR